MSAAHYWLNDDYACGARVLTIDSDGGSTTDPADVTCKRCLRTIARLERETVGGMTGVKTHYITRRADERGPRKLACGHRGQHADCTDIPSLVTCERCSVWLGRGVEMPESLRHNGTYNQRRAWILRSRRRARTEEG